MARWRITRAEGRLGGIGVEDVLAGMSRRPAPADPTATGLPRHEVLFKQVSKLFDGTRSNWVILPYRERQRSQWWQEQLGNNVEIGFGRAALALALSQLGRLAVEGRIIAVDGPEFGEEGIECELALDWTPAESGLTFDLHHIDGRLDQRTDLGAMLELGRSVIAQPEAVLCPGTGADGYLERLLPFMASLGDWAGQEVRWEFAEAPIGQMGVVGGLYTWAWLEAGYRLGDWCGPCAVLQLDESPLAGVSVVNWNAGKGHSAGRA